MLSCRPQNRRPQGRRRTRPPHLPSQPFLPCASLSHNFASPGEKPDPPSIPHHNLIPPAAKPNPSLTPRGVTRGNGGGARAAAAMFSAGILGGSPGLPPDPRPAGAPATSLRAAEPGAGAWLGSAAAVNLSRGEPRRPDPALHLTPSQRAAPRAAGSAPRHLPRLVFLSRLFLFVCLF